MNTKISAIMGETRTALFRVLLTAAVIITGAVSAIAAEETPKIAVYVTGGKSDSENRVLMTLILDALIRSGRYEAIERTDDFVAQIDREQAKQRSGAVDDNQIRQVGIQAGVQFVCITNMECAFGSCLISARIIDVETAKVAAMATADSRLGSMDEIRNISNEIVANMLNYRTAPVPPQPEKLTEDAAPTKTPAPAARTPTPETRERLRSVGVRYGIGGDEMSLDAVFTGIIKRRRGKNRGDLLVSYVNYKIETEKETYTYYGGYTYTTETTTVSGLETFGSYGWTAGDGPVSWYLGFGFGMSFVSAGIGYGLGGLTGIEIRLPDVAFSVDYHPMFRLTMGFSAPEFGFGYGQTFGMSVKYRF